MNVTANIQISTVTIICAVSPTVLTKRKFARKNTINNVKNETNSTNSGILFSKGLAAICARSHTKISIDASISCV